MSLQSIGSPTPIADAQAGDRGRSPKGRVGRRGRTTSPRGKPTFLAKVIEAADAGEYAAKVIHMPARRRQ